MDTLLTTKTASLTELREPRKILARMNGKPVAILNRNTVVAYLVPVEAVKLNNSTATDQEVFAGFDRRAATLEPVLEYLRDK